MERPFVVCHMLTSLDGKIDGTFFGVPETVPAIKAYGELRSFYGCQATLYGTTTMLAGGGIVNGSFLAENLVDELSLVIAPVADGGNGVSSFTQVDFLPSWPPTAFHLKEVQTVVPNVLWVRYTRP